MPLTVAETVAWVRYVRSEAEALPADRRRADLRAALELFAAIAVVDRSPVPADVLRRLDSGSGTDEPPPEDTAPAARLTADNVALRMRYQRTAAN